MREAPLPLPNKGTHVQAETVVAVDLAPYSLVTLRLQSYALGGCSVFDRLQPMRCELDTGYSLVCNVITNYTLYNDSLIKLFAISSAFAAILTEVSDIS